MAALGSSYFVFKAKDNVSPVAKGIRSSLGSIKASVGFVGEAFKVAAAAATVAVGAISAGAALAVKAAIAEEREISVLNSLLETRGLLTERNTKRVEEAIIAGQKLAFTDSEIRSGISAATQFTGKFSKALKIMSVAQDLARARNLSLEKATLLVGKAFAGNTGALSRYGIKLEKGVKGQKALNAVTKVFEGAAEGYADTTAGMLDRYREVFDNLRESIGGAFLPAIQKVLRGLGPVVDALVRDVTSKLPDLEKFASDLATKIPGLVANIYIKAKKELPAIIDKVAGFIRGISDFAKDAAAFLGPDGLIATGIAAIGYKIGGLRGAITAVLTKAFSDVGLGEFESLLAASIVTAVVSGLGSALVQAAVLAFAAKLRGGAAAAAAAAIPLVAPAGAATTAAGAATTAAGAAATSGVGAVAVAGVTAVAGAAAAVAAIVGIAGIAYSSLVPKDVQAAISANLGAYAARQNAKGQATGAGGTYGVGGATTPSSDYLNRAVQNGVVEGFKMAPPAAPIDLTNNLTLKLDGRVIAQSVDKYLGLTTSSTNPSRLTNRAR